MNRDDVGRPHLPQQKRWHLHRDTTVHQKFSFVEKRPEKARIGTTGSDGHDHVATVAEENGIAHSKIRGYHAERNLHVLKPETFEHPVKERFHALTADKPHSGETP